MTILPKIEAVLCDMDGLLLDSERLSMEAVRLAGLELGADLPEAFCQTMIGCPMDVCAAMALEKAGPGFPVERFAAVHEGILARLVEAGGMATRPGVGALLDMLDALGLKRAVVTSSSRARATHHLELAGILHRFDLLVTRDDVSVGKPDPEPYRVGASLVGVAADACLALEDSYNGVRSAHAAGIRVIMVPDLLGPTAEMRERAWHVMDDLHVVAALLRQGSDRQGLGRQADSDRALQAFGARFGGTPDDLGRLIFPARVSIASGLGRVSDATRVMITAVEGDKGELVVFRSLVLDIGTYQLSFAATDQRFSVVGDRVLRIEGSGGETGPYVCEIDPVR